MQNRRMAMFGATLLVGVTALLFCWKFRHAVFAGDMGLKYLQAMTFQQGPLVLDYPGARFDPNGSAFPFEPPTVFNTPQGWVSVWLNPMVLFLVPLFDRLFGWAGYLMAPFLGGFLTVYALRNLGRELHLPSPDLAAALVWLATPLLFYSLVLWEHTLSVGFGLMAMSSLLRSQRKSEPIIASSLWLGGAALFRVEAAIAAGILCLAIWARGSKRFSLPRMVIWGGLALLPPILWGALTSWIAMVPTKAQVTFPYLSPFSPWSGNEIERHVIKSLQTLVEPFQDASPLHLALSCGLLVPFLMGMFPREKDSIVQRAGLVLLLAIGLAFLGIELTTEKVFFAGIFAACPAVVAVPLIQRRAQTKPILWAWVFSILLIAVVSPNNGGLQRGCRYLLLPCVFGVFLVIVETIRTKGVLKWILASILLLGLAVQIHGVSVLWKHKSAKEVALASMIEDRPDFVLTSVWYFPQEAGRIYSEIPILWPRSDADLRRILIESEKVTPPPKSFLIVLPAQSGTIGRVDLPHWVGEKCGQFGGLPILKFTRVGKPNA